jgi:hypothetical protein
MICPARTSVPNNSFLKFVAESDLTKAESKLPARTSSSRQESRRIRTERRPVMFASILSVARAGDVDGEQKASRR